MSSDNRFKLIRPLVVLLLSRYVQLTLAVCGFVGPFVAIEIVSGGDYFRWFLTLSVWNIPPFVWIGYLIVGMNANYIIQLLFLLSFGLLWYFMPIVSVLASIVVITKKEWYFKLIGSILLCVNSILCILLFSGML